MRQAWLVQILAKIQALRHEYHGWQCIGPSPRGDAQP
jgi:hypothetical protein